MGTFISFISGFGSLFSLLSKLLGIGVDVAIYNAGENKQAKKDDDKTVAVLKAEEQAVVQSPRTHAELDKALEDGSF